jgi:hypothetical protein
VLVSIFVTLTSRIYKGGQGPLSKHDLWIILHLRQCKPLQDVGYYAPSSPNLSKLCVPCTFEFLISVFTHPKSTTLGIPLGGQPVKHRQILISFFGSEDRVRTPLLLCTQRPSYLSGTSLIHQSEPLYSILTISCF